MIKRMLIDDTQPEETRVVIVNGNKIEDVEFESTSRKQIKGNIYLAKVMRVEPSLQAAFVDYGGNRHGFLAFGEIHPDYYHISEEVLAEVDKEVDDIIEAKKTALREREAERERIRAEKARRREERLKAMAEAEAKAQAEAEAKAAAENQTAENPTAENQVELEKQAVLEENAEVKIEEQAHLMPSVDDLLPEAKEMPIPNMPFLAPKKTPERAITSAVETVISESAPEAVENKAEIPYNVMADTKSTDTKAQEINSEAAAAETESTATEEQNAAEEKAEKSAPRRRVRRKRFNAKDETLKVLAEDSEADEVVKADAGEEDDDTTDEAANKETVEAAAPQFEINNNDEELPSNADADDDDDDLENDFELQRKLLKARKLYHRSTIQDVIKEGQVLLVQVVKEERGNKGAAMTTYLSLAGRYCVLMPNRIKSGGVSRKITNASDRKRLKAIVKELPLTMDMSMIVRTAGEDKTKADIVRDYNYLIRTWNNIRLAALKNKAPALIHEEGNLIKRALRDMFSKDTSEVIVDGESSYRAARDFIKMLAPQNLKKIKLNRKGELPLFQRFQVEAQLDKLHDTNVQLESGGYLVINPTEALVSIDVNSGKATKEKDLEETALKTNLEAADEIARQLRMRNLAGLVVVDFIDMEDPKNNLAIEKRMKEAMKDDRARVQIAKMSCFGLLEISRQRMHSSFFESNYKVCPFCHGKGLVRTIESSCTLILRSIEEEGLKNRSSVVNVFVPADVALYLLNQKREALMNLEKRYGISVIISADNEIKNVDDFRIERTKAIRQQTALKEERVKELLEETTEEDTSEPENKTETEENSQSEEDMTEEHNDELLQQAEENGNNYQHRRGRRDRRNRFDRRDRRRDRNRNGRNIPQPTDAEAPQELPQPKEEPVILYNSHEDVAVDAGDGEGEKKSTWWRKLIS